ncbi:MAG: hypothetical protein ACI9JN_002318 [Bacteroidia bacterium]|jgi:hypothetical protein
MHNHLKALIILGLVVLCCTPVSIAQSGTYVTVRDLEAWSSLQLKYKIDKKWSVSLEEQLRLRDDASNVDIYFSELGLNYKMSKKFALGFGARFIRDNDDVGKIQGYENHFRWNTDAMYKHKLDAFNFKYRLRYQSKNELGITKAAGDLPTNTVRFKFGTDYNFKSWKFDPEFSTEIFNKLQPNEGFDKIRFTLGTTYKTKKIGDFGAYFRMENELTGTNPKTTNIIGFKYKYTLKRKKNEA